MDLEHVITINFSLLLVMEGAYVDMYRTAIRELIA